MRAETKPTGSPASGTFDCQTVGVPASSTSYVRRQWRAEPGARRTLGPEVVSPANRQRMNALVAGARGVQWIGVDLLLVELVSSTASDKHLPSRLTRKVKMPVNHNTLLYHTHRQPKAPDRQSCEMVKECLDRGMGRSKPASTAIRASQSARLHCFAKQGQSARVRKGSSQRNWTARHGTANALGMGYSHSLASWTAHAVFDSHAVQRGG